MEIKSTSMGAGVQSTGPGAIDSTEGGEEGAGDQGGETRGGGGELGGGTEGAGDGARERSRSGDGARKRGESRGITGWGDGGRGDRRRKAGPIHDEIASRHAAW